LTMEMTMAIPQVAFPVPFDQIPAELKRLGDHARGLEAEKRVCHALIEAVQDGCPHPDGKMKRGTDYGGTGWVRCAHCDKEW